MEISEYQLTIKFFFNQMYKKKLQLQLIPAVYISMYVGAIYYLMYAYVRGHL